MASTVLPNGIIIPEKFSRDWYADLYHNWQELDNLLGGGTPKDGTLTIQKNGDTVGTFSANQATDETINITVPDVNDGTLTIQQNGTTVDTFTANSSSDKTVNISVPTKTSDLNNDSGFITGVSWNDVSNKPTFATVATSGSYNDLSNKPTIPTVNDATLTIQKNGTDVKTFTANASSDVTCNITVPTKVSDLTNDSCIPLAGTNALSGSIVPSTDNNYNLGDSSHNYASVYAYNFPTFMRATSPSDSSDIFIIAGTNIFYGAYLQLNSKNSTNNPGEFRLSARSANNQSDLIGMPDGTLTWGSKNVAMQEDVIPRSGGAVMTGSSLGRTVNDGSLAICSGRNSNSGGNIILYANAFENADNVYRGSIALYALTSVSSYKAMAIFPDGTLTWNGQPIQYVSDQRLKQQINTIDDKLLDAWEDVSLVQFKYNDAVDQKGKDKARLHTGYVVQQIDTACKSHGVDISQYGLYCHEEYPQETEEVEVEQADGTKTKETKVIREASEHYSLRYTEVYAVECMYLRRCIKQLTARIEELEKGNNNK